MKTSPPVVLYPGRKGRPDFALRVDGGTVWLTPADIADLFGTTTANDNSHMRNIPKEREFRRCSVIKESLVTAADGKEGRTDVYRVLEFNERPVLLGAGRVSNERMNEIVSHRYEKFDGHRRQAQRLAAAAEDLRALEVAAKSLEAQQRASGKKGVDGKDDIKCIESELTTGRWKTQSCLERSKV